MRAKFDGGPGGAAIEVALSNLDKVLYPETGTTKGEVIAYYTAIAPAILPHLAGRPVTRKRWPNGVDEPSFFEKNLPEHAPAWLARRVIEHSDRRVTYPLLESEAGMAWLGQQAALEIHVPQWRIAGHRPGPATRIVFDLDPGPGAGLPECAEVALAVKEIIEGAGLRAYPVTSGSKGIHLYVPLDREIGSGGASTVARQLATELEKLRPDLVTATMAKAVRKGKVLLDWSQNNPAKTTISPYSLRGRAHPDVAAPRTWAEIGDTATLRHLRFDEVLARWRDDGDLLAELDPPLTVSAARHDDDALAKYRSMRDPARTPEPVPADPPAPGSGDRFVVQEHHARRLHWDVRLERDGVLASWAVPKGPPTSPSQNRLAVRTEDHPLEYLTFHGTIPTGEYGGGEMTIWDTGTYETEKWRDDEVIVRFHGNILTGRFALIRTRADQWLMHLMRDQPPAVKPPEAPAAGVAPGAQRPADARGHGSDSAAGRVAAPFPRDLAPMLATPGEVAELDPAHWCFETKWDGFRVLACLDGEDLVLRSRTGADVTARYPRFAAAAAELSGHRVVLDGEMVVFDEHGVPDIGLLQADPARAEFVAFDLLYLDGTSLVRKRFADRRRVLEALAAIAPSLRVPPPLAEDGAEAVRLSEERGLEGVLAKRYDSVYLPGKRGRAWLKHRNWRTREVVVGGYRRSAARDFASLLVGIPFDDKLIYAGRVGTGFSDADMRELGPRLRSSRRSSCPFTTELTAAERKDAVWVDPVITGRVRFMKWTETGRLWHPAWLGEDR
ncbi:ATP-dependent DNA ligase [Nocardia higoensis]|uniref:ATP-dependent DNA ligase n=1 Tax=Nocardia higoensis TaxID=228599 RepID=UPI0009FE2DDA|nr:ATP-dependent DNA ligase [Nocardia higoensis]